jgi:hypothetical protein
VVEIITKIIRLSIDLVRTTLVAPPMEVEIIEAA